MNKTDGDSTGQGDRTVGERSSEFNLVGLFLTEQARLKRIAAGMGLTASDAEDVLQDVSVRALKWAGRLPNQVHMF